MYEYSAKDEDDKMRKTGYYGPEVILDLHGCDTERFTRKSIKKFLVKLCELIDMKRQDLHFWENDDETLPHSKCLVAVQFILTSTITVRCVPGIGNCYINVFSCKDFNEGAVWLFAWNWFGARSCGRHTMIRK